MHTFFLLVLIICEREWERARASTEHIDDCVHFICSLSCSLVRPYTRMCLCVQQKNCVVRRKILFFVFVNDCLSFFALHSCGKYDECTLPWVKNSIRCDAQACKILNKNPDPNNQRKMSRNSNRKKRKTISMIFSHDLWCAINWFVRTRHSWKSLNLGS